MNIALIIEQKFDPYAGGVQRTTSKLAKIFKSKGHHVVIISLNKTKNIFLWEEISVYYLSKNEARQELKNLILKEAIQVIINQSGYSLSCTKLLLKSTERTVCIINTLRINPLNFYVNHKEIIKNVLAHKKIQFLDSYLLRKVILAYHVIKQRLELGYIIKNTDAFVMLSESFREELYQLVPSMKNFDHKIYCINNPFMQPSLDVSQLKKENIILHVGRLSHQQKRVDLLMEIWYRLHQELTEWEFWVVGHGPDETFMKDFCSRNNLTRVKFFGKQNPEEFYKRAKIFHLTSAYEGFGNVLVEAQSFGCVPILFNSYSAASNIVVHGINGILVDPFHIEDYVQATLGLTNDREYLRKLSNSANKNIERFSYERTYLKWEKVFQSLNQLDE